MHTEKSYSWRKRLLPIHQWSGLLISWLLFVIFLGGTLSVFHRELDLWFKPELPHIHSSLNIQRDTQAGINYLQQHAPQATRWQINYPSTRQPFIELSWSQNNKQHQALIDAQQPVETPRATQGGNFFVELHHELHYLPPKFVYFFLTLVAVLALVTLLSGVISYRRIFTDFFLFRRAKQQRWFDLHRLLALLPLPFYLMIIYSGLVILGIHGVMMYGAAAKYPQMGQFYENLGFFRMPARGELTQRPLNSVDSYLQQGMLYFPEQDFRLISINNPNTTVAKLTLVANKEHQLSRFAEFQIYDLTNGKLLTNKQGYGWGEDLFGATIALHTAIFADYPILWLYFLGGLAGCAMIASGTFLWVNKRLMKQTSTRNIWWVDRLNLSVILGFPLSCLGYFYANRLLPVGLLERADWEIHCLFLSWLAIILWTFFSSPSITIKWKFLLRVGAVFLFLLPVTDIWVGHPIWQNIYQQDGVYLSIELMAWLLASCCILAANKIKMER